ncbi:mannose-1-phosphate guanylyltransferase/mannose-6-phosphate isomerase [Bosea sp. PAMC 26642]|uniref:mannose-1-phosphate guanylyltransferase/mannose-6-phosphate isomerase n=1 Tax=Bosea sp. (strain PAMC 26642) TaxID=1792307 RepID=UPI000770180C|nr:mannose-1-phosphate guanylyltransferase/mannose-6-phosphate isomerase [Bosea sp. PAMC 26642]AMJ62680.1 mannose-1-phosphate guanyltransferase [Bosea sp. PAMC 26642]
MVQSASIVPVIICGGAGSRLWPASREAFPKQFIALIGEESMFQKTLARVKGPMFTAPVIVTHADFRFLVASQMLQMGMQGDMLLEPARRDSGPAIAAAAAFVQSRHPGASMMVLPSDHIVMETGAFEAAVTAGATAANDGRIVTFGMIPDHPATGYGYIQAGASTHDGVKAVERFVEKPDAETATRYIAENYLWNSGMFLFRADAFLAELSKFEPAIVEAAQAAVAQAEEDIGFVRLNATAFEAAPKKSIDYALMEKTKLAAVVPASFGWSDVGNWSSVWEASPHDAQGNATSGAVELFDSRNCYVQTKGPLTVLIGMEDAVVIVEDDAVMVTHRDKAEAVKGAFEKLKAGAHPSVISSRRVYRPWGYYQTLDLGTRFQVKRILVDPGQKLSLQSHHHRAEHWVVVQGTAVVTRDKDEVMLRENESIYLPLGCTHRLVNPGKIPLEIIEVQSGSYLGEDDIVRYEDVYKRV